MSEHLSGRQRRPSMAKRKKRRIGAFSRRLSLSDLDLRTNAGKFANPIDQVGGVQSARCFMEPPVMMLAEFVRTI
jgi:hypothetical protein